MENQLMDTQFMDNLSMETLSIDNQVALEYYYLSMI